MSLVGFITGVFAIAEAIPVIRDAFHSAVSMYYAQKIAKATAERNGAVDDLSKAKTKEEIQKALGRIVRARAQ